MSLNKYRIIDLFIYGFILLFMQVVSVIAQYRLTTFFTLSITIVMLIILTVRWGLFALIHAAVVGLVYAFLATQMIDGEKSLLVNACIYGIGNCFIVINVLLLKLMGAERLYSGGWWLILYALVGFVSVIVGRSLVGMFFGEQFITSVKNFATTESLNFIFAIIILFITNKQENMLKDQKEYFLEVRLGGKNEN